MSERRHEWAASLFAVRTEKHQQHEVNHNVIALDANSEAEAIGIATQTCHRLYPTAQGWSNHTVSVVTTAVKEEG